MSGLSRVRLAEIIDRSIIPRQPVLSRNHNRIKRNERMKDEQRLVWRVLRHWNEITDGGRFPRRDETDPWMLGEDGPNCRLIAVQSPIELSHFVSVGVNLAVALCSADTLAGLD
jgi:hypothetical protein